MIKKLLIAALMGLWGTIGVWAQEEPEIVIELSGPPETKYPAISVWDKNEKQLMRLFQGKDSAYVLYRLDTVSETDEFISVPPHKKYHHVRYGKEDSHYRRFLFDENDILLGVADNVKTALALREKYNVPLKITEQDFINTFATQAILNNLADLEKGTDYQVYQVKDKYYVFQNGELVTLYPNEKEFNDFVSQLSKQNKQAKQQAEIQKAQTAVAATPQKRNPRRALVWGGTVEDQMYMPRAVNARPLPSLVPSEIPAGTHLQD